MLVRKEIDRRIALVALASIEVWAVARVSSPLTNQG